MMRSIFALNTLLLLLAAAVSAQNYQLVWSEEFNGTQLDLTKWAYDSPNAGAGNNELEYYTDRPENLTVRSGVLTIKALKENYGGKSYTSARILTKASWQYGKIEARIKLPYGQGIWPAFWMLGSNISSVGWPKCGEIDIMEMVGGAVGDKRVYGTAHWDNAGSHAQYGLNYTLSSGVFADRYHVFTATWDSKAIKWFVDGYQYGAIDITPSGLSEFHAPYFIILNLAVGGNWPGSPDASTVFPQSMDVDYVRVYQDAGTVPSVSLAAPANNSVVLPGSDITLHADAGTGATIQKAEFFQDALKIGETSLSPYEMTWHAPAAGQYSVSARLVTTAGFSSVSSSSTVTVGSGITRAPYGGTPWLVPGVLETENYDLGGSNAGYVDNDAVNVGGVYRPADGVDIEVCSDSLGGYDVSEFSSGEWMDYSVSIREETSYTLAVRAASSNASGASLRIDVDGVDKSGSIAIPNTGGGQVWTTVTVPGIALPAGVHTLRVVSTGGTCSVNWIKLSKPGELSKVRLISPNGGEVWSVGSIREIRWSNWLASNVLIAYSTNGGTGWKTVTMSTPAAYGFYRWQVPDMASASCLVAIRDVASLASIDTSDAVFSIVPASAVDDERNLLPAVHQLQNYPNPFNPSTTITYVLSAAGHAVVTVYDALGREVETLVDQMQDAGRHDIRFSSATLPSGVYYVRLCTQGTVETRAIVLLR